MQAKLIFSLTLLYIFSLSIACLLKQSLSNNLDSFLKFNFSQSHLKNSRLAYFLTVLFTIFLSSLPLSVVAAPNKQISSIKVVNGNIQLNTLSGQSSVSSFYLDADKKSKARFVIDLKDTELLGKAYRETLNNGVIVRVNQFSTSPSVVRVVLEGSGEEIQDYSILNNSKSQLLLGKISKTSISKKLNAKEGVKSSVAKTSLVQDINYDKKELTVEMTDEVSIKTFVLDIQDKKMFVVDVTKASISGNKFDTSFSKKETETSEIIRVAQFQPGTVRLVIEGPEATKWKAELKDSKKIFLLKGEQSSDLKQSKEINEKDNKESKELKSEEKVISNSKHKIHLEGDSPLLIKINAQSPQKPISYKTFKMNSPERLVVDLYNWEGDLQELILNADQLKKQSSLLLGLRVGRPYKDSKVARLVFDLGQKGLKVQDDISASKQLLTFKLVPGMSDAFNENLNELKKVRKKLRVVIDAGHGGYDAGAIYSGIEEKNLTLEISKKLGALLSSSEIEVIQTREDDRFVSLNERVNITRKAKPDIFVSVHCNAMESASSIHGIESYYFTPQSQTLAHVLHEKIVHKSGSPDRHVRKARFVVIRETSIPSVLLELGFLSNASERSKLITKDYQNTLSKAITEGIVEYLADLKASASSSKESKKK